MLALVISTTVLGVYAIGTIVYLVVKRRNKTMINDQNMQTVLTFLGSLPENKRQDFLIVAKILSDSDFNYASTLRYALKLMLKR